MRRWIEFTDHDYVTALLPEDRIAGIVITGAARHRGRDPRGSLPAGHVVSVTLVGQEGDPITDLIITEFDWARLIGRTPIPPHGGLCGQMWGVNATLRCVLDPEHKGPCRYVDVREGRTSSDWMEDAERRPLRTTFRNGAPRCLHLTDHGQCVGTPGHTMPHASI